jgi:nucleotidyltransferase/DNA polymerase involved in DNA repair
MSFANNTPVQYLPGIGWRTANVLNDLGIHTAGQLHRIPESVLIELFGPSIRSVLRNVDVSVMNLAESESRRFAARVTHSESSLAKRNEHQMTHKLGFGQRLKLATQFLSVL